MIAPVFYLKDFVYDPDQALKTLANELAWVDVVSARQEYYCNDVPNPYVYGAGKGQREYQVQPWHPTILQIREDVEKMLKEKMEVCFLNRYLTQRNALGWHADDSPEMDDKRSIAVVSLGAEREIWFRPILGPEYHKSLDDPAPKYGTIEKLLLQHGSIAVMSPGMQDLWQHRIPKCDRECGERISLTFRGYVS